MTAMQTSQAFVPVSGVPVLNLDLFEGPLDLLCHLIEKNRIDIYDIPIDRITDQYLAFLEQLQSIDMEIASEFILMAATLLHIKSRMMLPQKKSLLADDVDDPREELVLKLLAYRRCRAIADDLKTRYQIYADCLYKPPESPASVGAVSLPGRDIVRSDLFWEACRRLVRQNQIRFQDVSGRISHLLKREKISLRQKMFDVLEHVMKKTKIFFHEIFSQSSSNSEKVTGFLAILELLRQNRILVSQDRPFDVMLIEPDHRWLNTDDPLAGLEDPEDPDGPENPEPAADITSDIRKGGE
jgi:segregation and condensation protein A